jgi:hypothetical protein
VQTEESNNPEYQTEQLQEKTVAAIVPASPNNPPWNSLVAFSVWLLSVIFIVVFPNLFILPYLIQKGVTSMDAAQVMDYIYKDPTAIILNVLAIIPAHILTLVLAWLVVTRFNKYSFRDILGWNWGGFTWLSCLLILGGFFVLAAIIGYFVPEQDNDLLRILRSSRTAVYIVAFMATFTAPLVEEVIYRGILYSAFQRTMGVTVAVFVVTMLFALVHVPQYYPSYSTIFLIVLLSLILTLIRARTDNLLPCIVLHTIFNGFQSVLLILEPFFGEAVKQAQEKAAAVIHLF